MRSEPPCNGQCYFADYTYPTLPDAQHTRCMTLNSEHSPFVPYLYGIFFIFNLSQIVNGFVSL
jgi:hypothetical protein